METCQRIGFLEFYLDMFYSLKDVELDLSTDFFPSFHYSQADV